MLLINKNNDIVLIWLKFQVILVFIAILDDLYIQKKINKKM